MLPGQHFRKGDVIVCVEPDYNQTLTEGSLYVVLDISPLSPDGIPFVNVIADNGSTGAYYPSRFCPVPPPRLTDDYDDIIASQEAYQDVA